MDRYGRQNDRYDDAEYRTPKRGYDRGDIASGSRMDPARSETGRPAGTPPREWYGGLRSDSVPPSPPRRSVARRGLSDFSTGGGTYDTEYSSGRDWVPDRIADASRRWDREMEPKRVVTARDIMTVDPEAVTGETRVREVAKLMLELNVGIIPVIDDEDARTLIGIVTDRDLAVRVLAAGRSGRSKVSDCMTEDIESVRSEDTVHKILEVMERRQIRRVPVTDAASHLLGIVAQADLAVDYAGLNPTREREVENTLERISQPARPQRRPRG
jgi:CBS domain-containing protein